MSKGESLDQLNSDYHCPCGKRTQELQTKQVSCFAYILCRQCGYPCPDSEPNKDGSQRSCPMCQAHIPLDFPAVCVIDRPTTVIKCAGCEGIVPLNELEDFTSEFTRLSLQSATTTSKSAAERNNSCSPEACLFKHRVRSQLVDGQVYIQCARCETTLPVAPNSRESVLERAGELLELCPNCSTEDCRRIVIEDGDQLLIKCCRQYKAPNWPSIRKRFTGGKWGLPVKTIPVTKLTDLQVSDHVIYRRALYDHHALISSVDPINGTYTQIHYTEGSKEGIGSRGGPSTASDPGLLGKGVVLDQERDFNPDQNNMEIIVYAPLDCYTPAEVIRRGQSRISEKCYNLVTSNCEHLVRWCKVGEANSGQVDSLVQASNTMSERKGNLIKGGLLAAQVLSDPGVRSKIQEGAQLVSSLWGALGSAAGKQGTPPKRF